MKVLITGGSGLVGRRLTAVLQEKRHEVAWLSSRHWLKSNIPIYEYNYSSGEIDNEAIRWADVIVHLAGANVGEKKWSKKRRNLIMDSRVKTANLIFKSLKENEHQVKAFISASAVGYYGAVTTENIFTEESAAGSDFLSTVCQHWEKAADAFTTLGIRVVKIRSGVVWSNSGGALEKIIPPFKFGANVVLGNGKQYMPWIHIDDLCNIYLKVVEDESMQGVYNAVAPEHTNYGDFIRQLKPYFKRVFLNVKVPAFALRLVFGKMAVLLLDGSRVEAKRLAELGFQFQFPTLKTVFNNLLK